MTLSVNGAFRALIVDDDELSRDVASSVLTRLGATEVVETSSGAAAIAWADANEGPLDLILCDLRMPQLDGLETLDELAKRTYPRMFVLASGADRRTIRAAGASARVGAGRLRVVDKPVTLEKLRDIVSGLFNDSGVQGPKLDLLKVSVPDCSTDMVRGLANGEFIPYFVPKYHLGSRRIDGAEALWRWKHPRYGILGPLSFASVAENVGLTNELFFAVFREVVAQCARWNATAFEFGLSMNVPPSILTERDLPRRLEQIVSRHGVSPRQITLEIAESAWLQEREHAREVVTRLRLKGFGLSIDEFGSGFSTIKQLIDAPFNEMKLDPSFIQVVPADRETAIALSSYLTVARQLDMMIVMQGVETIAQQEHAMQMGCDRIQGALIGTSMSAEEFTGVIEAQQVATGKLAEFPDE